MFHRGITYPLAVTSPDPEGLRAGIGWCANHMEQGDLFTVWTHLKGNLSNSDILEGLVKGIPTSTMWRPAVVGIPEAEVLC